MTSEPLRHPFDFKLENDDIVDQDGEGGGSFSMGMGGPSGTRSAGPGGSGSGSSTPLKRRRITCSPGPRPSVCGPCAAFGSECTYDRPMKRRGPPARSQPTRPSSTGNGETSPRELTPSREERWVYTEITSPEMIESLIDAFHRIIYPMYVHPFFHWPTFTAQVRRKLYTTSRPFHAAVMSVCALTAARLRDGAPQSPGSPSQSTASEAFYNAAQASIPTDLTCASHFDYKRAKFLLAMLSVQYGHIGSVLRHLGDYLTMCAIDGFHSEARWPSDLTEVEKQERRRLFWSAYQMDVYCATTWGGIIRHRESQITVLYPSEVYSDEDITPDGILAADPDRPVSFMRGWNFVSDLYRILEHALSQMRTRHQVHEGGNPMAMLFASRKIERNAGPGPDEILNVVETLFDALPEQFKGVKEMTGNAEKDRYGFQAANILITLQTVKMVMAGMAEWSVEQRCAIAGELLDSLSALPKAYIRASSSPMLHHLAGVGHLLAGIINSPLSPSTYLRVRDVLLTMADVLSSLEVHLSCAVGIALRLREQVDRIDRYMVSATEHLDAWSTGVGPRKDPPAAASAPTLTRDPTPAPIPVPALTNNASSASSSHPSVPFAPTTMSATAATVRPYGVAASSSNIPSGPGAGAHVPIEPRPPVPSNFLSYAPSTSITTNNNNTVDPLALPPQLDPIFQAQAQGIDQQVQLPTDLFTDWSFLFGEFGSQGDAFDFLSANPANNNNSNSNIPSNTGEWAPQFSFGYANFNGSVNGADNANGRI
ncbi:hypothetical protein I317_00751 [Kwoniella heveanensis CBS 569]|nr:hypothetical protein I317_00751 [Kwoniella heveanensis CBS 569]